MKRPLALTTVLALVCLALAAGCAGSTSDGGAGQAADTGTITVGSKIDTEGELLSSIIKLVLENAGYTVVDKSQTGTTDVVRKALLNKEIDIYPEYTGSGLIFFPKSDSSVYKNGEAGYAAVKAEDLKANKIVWLTPAKANNTWAIAAKQSFAQAQGLDVHVGLRGLRESRQANQAGRVR